MRKLVALALGAAFIFCAPTLFAGIIPVTGAPTVSLEQFAATLAGGDANQIVGVYIPDAFALRVLPQPPDDPTYVSAIPNVVTQFGLAAERSTIGLLAHSQLAGAEFSKLKLGDEVHVVYGDGKGTQYVVAHMRRFQALNPLNPYTDLRDLDSGDVLSSTLVFKQIYDRGNIVVFQTCIPKGDELSWGRLFVTAVPAD